MSHIDIELTKVKTKLMEMWDLVEYQLQSGREAMNNVDLELAKKIIKLGRKVNNYDVKIDRMCENIFALFTPVAVDLRVLLAILKINANLERIGDTAEGIAQFVQRMDKQLPADLVAQTRVQEMYEEALVMLAECRVAFSNNDTDLAKALIKRDKMLNSIYRQSDSIIVTFIRDNPDSVKDGLTLLPIIKKLERVGDQITNIAEEIIFYRDAKVIKHKEKKKKKKKDDENQPPEA
ncbi:phosphate signaling complex protein PhoU [Botryobacter ruber]|uniref:phosphate signaling complex protein PhoU n=1 Tax=Botryobacter ruber TaxID=2171629 RepID=UPI000E0A934F|nr:phosphate signaling complex protein PhoU [Botryobacter ruber]